ncbi:MAG: hypothetical protein Q7P63_12450 [Verrucomicrobiota bacterium JB022]|nr:hypothetical protein [Verrucomicrobiota bacterium JB022]
MKIDSLTLGILVDQPGLLDVTPERVGTRKPFRQNRIVLTTCNRPMIEQERPKLFRNQLHTLLAVLRGRLPEPEEGTSLFQVHITPLKRLNLLAPKSSQQRQAETDPVRPPMSKERVHLLLSPSPALSRLLYSRNRLDRR